METGTGLIVLAVELATTVEGRVKKLNGWEAGFLMNIAWNATTFVFDG